MAGLKHSFQSVLRVIVAPLAMTFLIVGSVEAQLLSPGELSSAHARLEGVTNCTSCHTIGGKGVDQAKCLNCHVSIRSRMEAATGLHGALTKPCTECHKDHLGRDFDLVQLDTASFDHGQTGYRLVGAHAQANCSSCHRSDHISDPEIIAENEKEGYRRKTFLGLGTVCRSCHAGDSPHGSQFGERACSDCHTPEKWSAVETFDHQTAQFRLTGRHADVACEKCHPSTVEADGRTEVRFVKLAHSECSDCHNDPHASRYGASCHTCHTTEGWSELLSKTSFSHEQTGYRLSGAHAQLSCRSCHGRPARNDTAIHIRFVGTTSGRTFPKIRAASCLSCHVDYHNGSFRSELADVSCDKCHSSDGWIPTSFDIDRHQESRFGLTGAHLSVPCSSCHASVERKWTFVFEDRHCASCHAKDNPHGHQFDQRMADASCGSCHSTEGWNSEVDFDHKSTGFNLTGAHANLRCAACHTAEREVDTTRVVNFKGLSASCSTCHAEKDPHQGQFEGKDCGSCHNTTRFVPIADGFDHRATRFPLDGAHSKIACAKCHGTATAPDGTRFTRYVLNKTQCVDCHSSG